MYLFCGRVNKRVGLNVIFFPRRDSNFGNPVHSHSLNHQYKERRGKDFDNVGGRQNKYMKYEKPLTLRTHLTL